MRKAQFKLRDLLAVFIGAGLVFSAVADFSFLSAFIVVGVYSLATAWIAIQSGESCVLYGGAGGACAVAALIVVGWPTYLLGYFWHTKPWPYFEDGFFVAAVFLYIPIGAFAGGMVGAGLRASMLIYRTVVSRARS